MKVRANKGTLRRLVLAAIGALSGVGFCPAAGTNEVSPSGQYARAYEIELGAGDLADALRIYRQLAKECRSADPSLAGKALFRAGMCERQTGRIPEAKEAWSRLAEMLPAEHPLVLRAQEELKAVEREINRAILEGRAVDEAGKPLAGAYMLIGDWGRTPPVGSDAGGRFRAERRVAGRLASGARYCLIYAEHAFLPLTAAGIVAEKDGEWRLLAGAGGETAPRGGEGKPIEVVLRASFALSGYVVDANGRPVAGSAIRVTGFADQGRDIPLPFGNFLPVILSDSNGQFRVPGLTRGLRYLVVAEKEGYRLGRGVELAANRRADGGSGGRGGPDGTDIVHVAEIILQPIGRMNIDEQGLLRAEVNLRDPVERGRLEDMIRRFGEGASSRTGDAGRDAVWQADRQPLPAPFPFASFPFALQWLRGDPSTGAALTREDLNRRPAVYHFSSAYLDASLKSQFPGEAGTVTHVARLFSRKNLLCIWVLPASDDSDEAARLALEACPEAPVAIDRGGKMWKTLGVAGYGGNVVVDSEGLARPPCSDQQLFRTVKEALASETK